MRTCDVRCCLAVTLYSLRSPAGTHVGLRARVSTLSLASRNHELLHSFVFSKKLPAQHLPSLQTTPIPSGAPSRWESPNATMFDTICNLPLSSELFAQAIHPTEPLVAVGLSAGHVQTFRLPPVATSEDDDSSIEDAAAASENGFGQIETAWRTRRHKGSCRSLAYSIDGEALYSAGTDGLVKAASAETGQVLSKINVPRIGFVVPHQFPLSRSFLR